MKKSIPMILAAATALTLASQANAGITMVSTPVAVNATLTSAGYSGFRITLIADGVQSAGVNSWDFTNHVTGFTEGGIVGISGPVHQDWLIDPDDSSRISTPTGVPGVGGLPPAVPGGVSTAQQDSYWNGRSPTTSGFAVGTNPAEDNTFTGGPVADDAANDFGIGNIMTSAVAIKTGAGENAPITFNLAFVIAKVGAGDVLARGVALDPTGAQFLITGVVNPGTVLTPEPASIGLLGAAGLSLLARRRK